MSIDPRNLVRLRVNGKDYGGWTSVNIAAGIERAARDFSLTVTDRWPGSDLVQRIKPFNRCELWIGRDKVLTGSVDATPVSYDDESVSVSINGRSITADLVDCAAINEPGQWKSLKLEAIAADLAEPYSIEVIVAPGADTGPVLAQHQIQQGETAFESIDRMLKLRQVLATDDAYGRLVLTSPGTERAADALVLGENVLSCNAPFDFKDVYSQYLVKGQRSGTDEAYGPACSTSATETDLNIPRQRVMIIRQQGQSDGGGCARRAQYERARRMTKALEVTYTVQGWRQSTGALWLPNQLVRVKDPVTRLERDMLIAEVAYRLDSGGTVAALRVGPPEGYEAEPPEVAAEKRAKAKAGEGAATGGVDQWVSFWPGEKKQ